MNDKKTIRNYLKLAGVNEMIISYLENKEIIYPQIIEFLGEDFISGMDVNPKACVEKLKKGSFSFKILEKGFVWFLTDMENKKENIKLKNNFYVGAIALEEEKQYSSITKRSYVSIEDNQIIVRTIIEKLNRKNLYDGEITEERYTPIFNRTRRTTSYWFNQEVSGIPSQELSIEIEEINEFGFSNRTFSQGNFSTQSWNLVYNGEFLEKKEILDTKKSLKNKLKAIKNSLLFKMQEEDQSRKK